MASSTRSTALALVTTLLLASAACGGADKSGGRPPGSPLPGGSTAGSGAPATGLGSGGGKFGNSSAMIAPPPAVVGTVPLGCTHLQCQQHSCSGGGSTTISGTVYDPAGKNPIYNVAVYVPNAPVAPLTLGASCYACGDLYTGKPIATALTDASGKFVLPNAPDGKDIPLVVQVGKWRKQLTLPSVTACQDNPLPDKSLRLPKNQSEGDIPSIAISTGGADTLECLLRRIGLDPTEYGPGASGTGRIHIFQGSDAGMGAGGLLGGLLGGGGMGMVIPGVGYVGPAPNTSPAAPKSSAALWDSVADLMPYDILLLSCEGQDTQNMNQQALHDYASGGGRVFASHFHYAWFNTGPYASENLATWTTGANSIGNVNANIVTTLPNGGAFPKGQALKDWLMGVGALTNGELPIQAARHNADVTAANTVSQTWITADQSAMTPGAVQYFSFNTPTDAQINPDHMVQCGRVVYSDLHVGAASMDNPVMPVPASCTSADLSPQEKALEFMLFDLSSCLTPDNRPPAPPPVVE
jgi:hypothetical protein